MPAAVIGLVGTMYATDVARRSANRASRTISETARLAREQQREFFDFTTEQLAPYVQIGNDAVDKIRNVFLEGNMDEFYDSPGYKFNLEQGEKALERKQAANQNRYGGGAIKESLKFAQGLASNEFGNFFTRLKSLADMGGNAAARTGNAAMTTGTNLSNITLGEGQAQVGIEAQRNQITQGGISNVVTLAQYNDMLNRLNPQQTPDQTTTPVMTTGVSSGAGWLDQTGGQ